MKGTTLVEKEKFLENLQKLVDLGKSKKNTLDMNDINDMFVGVDLSVEDLENTYQYLENKGIDVLRVMDDKGAIPFPILPSERAHWYA